MSNLTEKSISLLDILGSHDPDMEFLNQMTPEQRREAWESVKPKLKSSDIGKIQIFGTMDDDRSSIVLCLRFI